MSNLVNLKRLHLTEILFKIGSTKIGGCGNCLINVCVHVWEKQNQAWKFDLIYRDNLRRNSPTRTHFHLNYIQVWYSVRFPMRNMVLPTFFCTLQQKPFSFIF